MGLLQQIYMWILNPIYKITSKVAEPVRNKVVAVCFFLIAVQALAFTALEKQGIYYGYDKLLITGAIFFCIAIIFSVKSPLNIVKWNPVVYIPWFICCTWMIITGFHHNISSSLMFFAGLMLVVFPCFYFVWNNRQDYEVMFKLVAKAIVVAMGLYYIANFLLVPHTMGIEYYGVAVNPNSLGLAGTGGVIASLYLTLTEKKKWPYITIASLSIAFVYFSLSRACAIVAFITIIIFVFFSIKYQVKNSIKMYRFVLIVVLLIGIIVSIFGSAWILENITPLTKEKINNVAFAEVYAYDDIEEDTEKPLINEFTKGNNLETLSSGRTVIWKAYIRKLNFVGNDRAKALYVEELGLGVSAHNTYLEIGYRCGVLAGLLYAWIAIYAAIYSFNVMFARKTFCNKYALIPMAVMAFGVLSNLERALFPFEKIHILLFFIVLAPIFAKRIK